MPINNKHTWLLSLYQFEGKKGEKDLFLFLILLSTIVLPCFLLWQTKRFRVKIYISFFNLDEGYKQFVSMESVTFTTTCVYPYPYPHIHSPNSTLHDWRLLFLYLHYPDERYPILLLDKYKCSCVCLVLILLPSPNNFRYFWVKLEQSRRVMDYNSIIQDLLLQSDVVVSISLFFLLSYICFILIYLLKSEIAYAFSQLPDCQLLV